MGLFTNLATIGNAFTNVTTETMSVVESTAKAASNVAKVAEVKSAEVLVSAAKDSKLSEGQLQQLTTLSDSESASLFTFN